MNHPTVTIAPSPFVVWSTAGASEGVQSIAKSMPAAMIQPSPKIQLGRMSQ